MVDSIDGMPEDPDPRLATAAAKLEKTTHMVIQLDLAALCINCSVVFQINGVCPSCAADTWMPLATFLNRTPTEPTL